MKARKKRAQKSPVITWIESFTVEGHHVLAVVHSEIPAPDGEDNRVRVRISRTELDAMLKAVDEDGLQGDDYWPPRSAARRGG